MEYILIFISAIFVNNIVLSQFLGICPFLGVADTCNYCNLACSEICTRCLWTAVSANHCFYPCYCIVSADG